MKVHLIHEFTDHPNSKFLLEKGCVKLADDLGLDERLSNTNSQADLEQ